MADLLASTGESVEAQSSLESLAQYLREKRDVSSLDVSLIAKELDLDPGFVEDVITALEQPDSRQKASPYELFTTAKEIWDEFRQKVTTKLKSLTSNASQFVFVTMAVTLGLVYLLRFLGPVGMTNIGRLSLGTFTAFFALVTGIVHLLCYYRQAAMRFPIKAGGFLFLGFVPLALINAAESAAALRVGSVLGAVSNTIVVLIFSLAYTAVGVGFAWLGGYAQLQREVVRERKMSRQDLLTRLFEVQDRLANLQASGRKLRRDRSIKEEARSMALFPFTYAPAAGFLFGILEVAAVSIAWHYTGEQSTTVMLLNLVAYISFPVGVGVLGYLSGALRRSMISTILALLARVMVWTIPISPYGPNQALTALGTTPFFVLIGVLLLIAIVSGAGGRIDERISQRHRIRNDDPASLVADLIRLQRELAPKSRTTCVMVVDVAKSTRIKSEANPLEVEFSFREYQRLIKKICATHHGEIISTAGDGAVATFTNPQDCMEAAKQLHSQISKFNQEVNRLARPFRLRIGIHCGETQADLNMAPFNELIDIAAHVEAAAPVGGIAVTERFRTLLPDEMMAEVKQEVDGHRIAIVLNPVVVA